MSSILVVYSTTDGHTRTICDRLSGWLEADGHVVRRLPIARAGSADLAACNKVVVGASIRYGKHKPEVAEFACRYQSELDARPNAFFSVNIVARKPFKSRPETNPYLQRFLRQVAWRPRELDVFAGRLDYPRLGFLDRQMIRFIMLITHGPTDQGAVVEFTDWQRVQSFARRVSAM